MRIKLKPFRQSPGLCGPASLKIVLDYYGVRKSERELARLSRCKPTKGIELAPLLKIAKKFGFSGFVKDFADIRDIKKYIRMKVPVIVDWFSENEGHYSVVAGVDAKNIYLMDPELGGIRTMKIAKFKSVWFDFPGEFLRSKKDIIIRRMMMVRKGR